jgi:hypothetical protein
VRVLKVEAAFDVQAGQPSDLRALKGGHIVPALQRGGEEPRARGRLGI